MRIMNAAAGSEACNCYVPLTEHLHHRTKTASQKWVEHQTHEHCWDSGARLKQGMKMNERLFLESILEEKGVGLFSGYAAHLEV